MLKVGGCVSTHSLFYKRFEVDNAQGVFTPGLYFPKQKIFSNAGELYGASIFYLQCTHLRHHVIFLNSLNCNMEVLLNVVIVTDEEISPPFFSFLFPGRVGDKEISGYNILVRRVYLKELSTVRYYGQNAVVIYYVKEKQDLKEANQDIILINSIFPSKSIIVCGHTYRQYITNKLKAGKVAGYMFFSDPPQEKARVVDEILKGNIALSRRVMAQYLHYQHKKNANQLSGNKT